MTFAQWRSPEKRQSVKSTALIASSTGAGAFLAVFLRERPELLFSLISSFGPMFLVVLSMMYLVDKHAGQFIETQREGALATQRMAVAIEAIAKKDDERDREMDLVIGRLTRNSDRILERLTLMEQRMQGSTEKGAAHGAS